MPGKTTAKPSPEGEPQVTTLDDWKAARRLVVTLESGRVIALRTLTLDELAANEALPEDLIKVAMLEQIPGGLVAEIAAQLDDGKPEALEQAQKLSQDNVRLRDRLVLAAVLEPKLTEEDLDELDPYDKAEIAAFAQRRKTIDVTGRRVGAEPLATFRAFAQQHECPPDCEACQAAAGQVFGVQR